MKFHDSWPEKKNLRNAFKVNSKKKVGFIRNTDCLNSFFYNKLHMYSVLYKMSEFMYCPKLGYMRFRCSDRQTRCLLKFANFMVITSQISSNSTKY